MSQPRDFWIAGRPMRGPSAFDVCNPYDGAYVSSVSVPEPEHVEAALSRADAIRHEALSQPAEARVAALDHCVVRMASRREELARTITAESGKPLKWARAEVVRAISTFRWAAEEARRWGGEMQRLDTESGASGRLALVRRFPRGAVLAITPFNFPLNLVAHKVAPALAIGAPVVVKPAPATPLSALLLGEILAETALPQGTVSVLPLPNDRLGNLVADCRLPVVSFTGSSGVGWKIKESLPRKHVTLELGGNAAAVVCPDADLGHTASRIATFANYQGGQSCVSVQRVLVQRDLYPEMCSRIVAAVEAQVVGDPRDERTDVGPLINADAARRVESWVDEAVTAGAKLLTGGVRDGSTYSPTVLTDVPRDTQLGCEEVFGPVLTIQPYGDITEAFRLVNASRYGLQAGVFTSDLQVAFAAFRELEVGGVVIGDVPSFRAEQMPYGGVKDSGVGREGVRYAMEDLSYERVMVLTSLDL